MKVDEASVGWRWQFCVLSTVRYSVYSAEISQQHAATTYARGFPTSSFTGITLLHNYYIPFIRFRLSTEPQTDRILNIEWRQNPLTLDPLMCYYRSSHLDSSRSTWCPIKSFMLFFTCQSGILCIRINTVYNVPCMLTCNISCINLYQQIYKLCRRMNLKH